MSKFVSIKLLIFCEHKIDQILLLNLKKLPLNQLLLLLEFVEFGSFFIRMFHCHESDHRLTLQVSYGWNILQFHFFITYNDLIHRHIWLLFLMNHEYYK